MKRFYQQLRRFLYKHLAYPERYEPDPQSILASVGRYFRYNEPGLVYEFACDPLYDQAVERLRENGWNERIRVEIKMYQSTIKHQTTVKQKQCA